VCLGYLIVIFSLFLVDDAIITFIKLGVMQSLTDILKQHIKNSDPSRHFRNPTRDDDPLAVVEVFAELAKRGSVTVVKDTKTILFPEDEINVLISLLQNDNDEVVNVASTTLNELAIKSTPALSWYISLPNLYR
jgi:hypothetical protein